MKSETCSRMILKRGISVNGTWYVSELLAGHVGKMAEVEMPVEFEDGQYLFCLVGDTKIELRPRQTA